ncbi:MAG: hypothetical protein JWQ02_676 [Capsulimonas sp.]|nr:hypothetical protein [Capsulimonas sp.]
MWRVLSIEAVRRLEGSRHITHIGYEIRIGDCLRSKPTHSGMPNLTHTSADWIFDKRSRAHSKAGLHGVIRCFDQIFGQSESDFVL